MWHWQKEFPDHLCLSNICTPVLGHIWFVTYGREVARKRETKSTCFECLCWHDPQLAKSWFCEWIAFTSKSYSVLSMELFISWFWICKKNGKAYGQCVEMRKTSVNCQLHEITFVSAFFLQTWLNLRQNDDELEGSNKRLAAMEREEPSELSGKDISSELAHSFLMTGLGISCRLKMFKNILPKLAEIFEHCKLNRHLTWTFWRTLAPRVNTSALGRFHVFWICRKGVCGKPLWFFKLDKGFASGHKHVRQGTKCTIKFWRKRAKNAGCQSNFLHDQLQGAIQQNLASHAAASRTLQHHLSPVSSSVEADYAAKSR